MKTIKLTTTQLDSIGQKMIKMVKDAIEIIRANCADMQVEDKKAYEAGEWDCVTIADKRAQEMYLREINRDFPTFGIIAEEQELTIPCTDQRFDIYFTIDPLDGTKAFARKQSHGVGTMLGLVCAGEIIACAIGDVNTGEVYAYASHEDRVTVQRLRFNQAFDLTPETTKTLADQYLFLLENPRKYPQAVREMIDEEPKKGGLFKDYEIGSGSIGLRFARLWKGEVAGIALLPGHNTPWDLTPVAGISQKLGFKFLELEVQTGRFTEFKPELQKTIATTTKFCVVVHETHVAELRKWMQKRRANRV